MRKLTFLAIAMIALAIAPLSLGAANPNKMLISAGEEILKPLRTTSPIRHKANCSE